MSVLNEESVKRHSVKKLKEISNFGGGQRGAVSTTVAYYILLEILLELGSQRAPPCKEGKVNL